MKYRHTQLGSVMIAAIAVGLASILVSLGFTGVIQPIPLAVMLILGLALIVFNSLTIEIRNSELECRLGPGIIRKRFALSEIDGAKRVQIPWYSGWGIRWFPGQYLLWRVSGFQAVELVTKDGRRFRVGTDDPDNLIEAIRAYKSY